jgi:hypothetical protein
VPLVKTAALLAECLADEPHLVVAPFFVGGSGAPRFVSDARFPFDAAHPMTLAEVRQIGDVRHGRRCHRPEAPLTVAVRVLRVDGPTPLGTRPC